MKITFTKKLQVLVYMLHSLFVETHCFRNSIQIRDTLLLSRDVQPGELVTFTEHFRPKKEGERKIVGAFNSKQLTEVTGSSTVNVKDAQ